MAILTPVVMRALRQFVCAELGDEAAFCSVDPSSWRVAADEQRQKHLTARLRECNFQRRKFLPRRESPMGKVQSIVLVRWVADREIIVCGLLNRMSRAPKIKNVFVLVSWLGDGKAWYLLMVALPLIYGEKGLATSWNMVTVGVANLVLYKAIKNITGRPRPDVVSKEICLGTAPLDQYSFPSGHTMHAVAFSLIAGAHHTELSLVLIPASSLIALSRVILGLHYPTDVIAGGVIGGYVASWLLVS
jgi:undecaprenyl-diphosphatase